MNINIKKEKVTIFNNRTFIYRKRYKSLFNFLCEEEILHKKNLLKILSRNTALIEQEELTRSVVYQFLFRFFFLFWGRQPLKTNRLRDSYYEDVLIYLVQGIGLHVNAHKTEYKCFNQTGDISTLDGSSLKLADKFTYLGSSVSSTEKDIDTRLTKAWTAIDRLSIIWKSGLTDKMKRSFFQAAVVSIMLCGGTTWTLTKRLEKKIDGN